MLFAGPAEFFQHDFFLLVQLVFIRDIILALAGLADQGYQNSLFFLSHTGIIAYERY